MTYDSALTKLQGIRRAAQRWKPSRCNESIGSEMRMADDGCSSLDQNYPKYVSTVFFPCGSSKMCFFVVTGSACLILFVRSTMIFNDLSRMFMNVLDVEMDETRFTWNVSFRRSMSFHVVRHRGQGVSRLLCFTTTWMFSAQSVRHMDPKWSKIQNDPNGSNVGSVPWISGWWCHWLLQSLVHQSTRRGPGLSSIT